MTLPNEFSVCDRADCAVCADWLATGAVWSQAALLAIVAALAAATIGARLGSAPGVLISLLAVGAIERYLALRVALDARLFDRLARGPLPDLAALDTALQRVLSVPTAKAGRDLSTRIAGARRLYRAQAAATLLLIVLAVVAWCGR
jgi:hypothetical protein